MLFQLIDCMAKWCDEGAISDATLRASEWHDADDAEWL